MKKFMIIICCLALAQAAPAVNYYWTGAVDQNFATLGNWNTFQDGSGVAPVTFDANGRYINLGGQQKAVISTDIGDTENDGTVRIGYKAAAGADSELLVTGGTNAFGNSLQIGGDSTGVSILTMTGGTLKFNASYATVGQSAATNGVMTMTGGTFETDRFTIANNAEAAGRLDISGGTIKIVNYMNTTTSGTLRFGPGAAQMNISGTAVVEMENLILGDTAAAGNGLLTITGGLLLTEDVTFVTGGSVVIDGGTWTLSGDKTAKIKQAVIDGYINHSGGNAKINVAYDSQNDVTNVTVPAITMPIHWWKCDQVIDNADPNTFFLYDEMDEYAGSIVNDGTYYAAFPRSGAGINGDYGTAFSMSRAAIRVNFGRALSWDIGSGDFTISGWILPTMPTSHARVLINGAWNQGGYSITVLKNNGRLTFEVFSGSAVDADNISVTSAAPLTDNVWHNFIAVSSAGKIYLYIDGKLQTGSGVAYKATTTAACTTAWAAPRPSNYIGQNMVGQFDDLRIYNTSLSSVIDAENNLIGGQAYNLWQGVFVDGPADCGEIWAAGYGSVQDYNRDCSVDSADLSVIAWQWLECNDPADADCQKPWL